MAAVAAALAARGIATLRYQFPYMERGGRRPDPPKVAHAAVRAAVGEASRLDLPLIAGGKSFGGRMTSQAQALSPLAGVRGLAFLGFPLHAAGVPSQARVPPARRRRRAPGALQSAVRRQHSHAVPEGHARQARRPGSHRAVVRGARPTRNLEAVRGRRSFVSRAGAHRAQGPGGSGRGRRRARRLDRYASLPHMKAGLAASLAFGCVCLGADASVAQPYPAKPIHIVVATVPGGVTDLLGRSLAVELGRIFGQQVVIENRPGANSQIAAEFVAKSPPDGYTLLLAPETAFVVNPTLYARLPYDAERDFTPVAGLAMVQQALVIHPALPANTVAELIALAKAKPGELNYGCAGIGSASH